MDKLKGIIYYPAIPQANHQDNLNQTDLYKLIQKNRGGRFCTEVSFSVNPKSNDTNIITKSNKQASICSQFHFNYRIGMPKIADIAILPI